MHASDYQDRDKANNEHQSNPTPSVEELSTAVKKKPIGSSVPVNEQAAEDLYTAVMKKPKEIEENDAIIVPPTPPLTIEELYTAVNKSQRSIQWRMKRELHQYLHTQWRMLIEHNSKNYISLST